MKTAFITGGSRGIGEAMVRLFSSHAYRVAFGYHSSNQKALLLEKETGAIPLQANLQNTEETVALCQAALKQLCHIDALIVNAGMVHAGLLSEMDVQDFDQLFALNVRSAYLCIKECLPALRKSGGSIVLISSIWGLEGASMEAAYSSSKAALIGLAKALAKEEGPSGVRVNCLCPGVIQTDMLASLDDEALENLRLQTPLMRIGTPMDVAKAAYFLCSEDASFITGECLKVDGGFL